MADEWWENLPNLQGYESRLNAGQQPDPTVNNEKAQATTAASAAVPSPPKRQVSSNACEPCRKRKSKCDGERPYCKSCCVLHMTPCHYDLDKDLRRKGALRQEIQRLKRLKEDFEFTLDALRLAEEPQLSEMMHLLRTHQSIHEVANTLRSFNIYMHPTPLPEFRGDLARNAFGNLMGGPVMEMPANQLNAQIVAEVKQNIQTPGMPDHVDLSGSQGVDMSSFAGCEGMQQHPPLNLTGYDETEALWQLS